VAEKKRNEKELVKEVGKNQLNIADSLFTISFAEKETGPKRTDFAPTPAGERRYIRALRAATPRKIKGDGITFAPNNSGTVAPTVATAKKAVAAAPNAKVTNAPHADNVAAQGAAQTVQEPISIAWWWWVLIIAVAVYAYRKLTANV
jgi:hypothetical protein